MKSKYEIVVRNDESYDGSFYYGVKTTGIFCRPSCKSKVPLEKNVVFFDTKEDAMNEGFRPCKRCRSDLDIYEPDKDLAKRVKELIEFDFRSSADMREKLKTFGLSKHRLSKIFKDAYGQTPNEFMNELRIEEIKRSLVETDDLIIDIAYEVGFNSLSPFYRFFKEHESMSPSEYRLKHSLKKFSIQRTSIGNIRVDYEKNVVIGISFTKDGTGSSNLFTDNVFNQLNEYLQGKRKELSFKYELRGTDFQMEVWNALMDIPYGSIISYSELAERIGKPNASRAVGMALGNNPILIVVPCHRVVGKNGKLTGYAGGKDIKKKLLEIEGDYE